MVTDDEKQIHHIELETKCQSMDWYHKCSLVKKKSKIQQSARKVTIYTEQYIQTLSKQLPHICRICPGTCSKDFLLQYNNAKELVKNIGGTTFRAMHKYISCNTGYTGTKKCAE
jgi:hypothetical protein